MDDNDIQYYTRTGRARTYCIFDTHHSRCAPLLKWNFDGSLSFADAVAASFWMSRSQSITDRSMIGRPNVEYMYTMNRRRRKNNKYKILKLDLFPNQRQNKVKHQVFMGVAFEADIYTFEIDERRKCHL